MPENTADTGHAQPIPIFAGEEELFPEHPPRADTPEYRATHTLLVDILDTPCRICGVKKSTLGDAVANLFKATALETHHYPIQREYYDACDWRKVARDFTQIVDQDSFRMFVDSPANIWVVCSTCHRSTARGIHHLTVNDWVIGRYLLDGYVLIDVKASADADIAKDKAIVDAAVPENERQ